MSQPQPEGLEDLEFCNCDPCVRAAEKEVIEAAAKQGLTVNLFDPLATSFVPHPFSSTSLGPSLQAGGMQ